MIRLWWHFQDTEFLISYRIPGKGYFVLGISGYLLEHANLSHLSSLYRCGCALGQRTAALCASPCNCTHTSVCAKPACQAAVLWITTLTQGYEVLHHKKLWKCKHRSCVLELNPEQKLPLQALHAEDTEENSKAGTTFCLLPCRSRKVPESRLLWGCVHSKQNMGNWASSLQVSYNCQKKNIHCLEISCITSNKYFTWWWCL